MVSSSSPFGGLKSLFKDSNHARTSNVSLNSEPAPSSSGSNRRPPSISASSHQVSSGSSSHQSLQHYNTQQQQQQQVYSSSQSEPPLHNRPLPPSPTQPQTSSRTPVNKQNNKRKDSTSFLKRFSLAHPSMDDHIQDIRNVYTAYSPIMDDTSVKSETSASHQQSKQRSVASNTQHPSLSQQKPHKPHKQRSSPPPPLPVQQTALPPVPPSHSKADSASEHSSSSSVGGDSALLPPLPQIQNPNPKEQQTSRLRKTENPTDLQHRARQQEKHEAPAQKIPKSTVGKKRTEMLMKKIEELQVGRDHEYSSLEKRYNKLQHTLDAKEAELSRISANFHNHVKTIRATDDDFSTIQVKLTMLQSKITALPLTLKKYAEDRTVMTRYFIQCWPELAPTIEQLCKKKGALDYNIICLFVEKLVTEEIVVNIYRTPIMIGLPTNDAYLQISEYMATHDKDWALRLRQQMCKLAVKSLNTNDAAAKPIAVAKKQVVDRIVTKLSHIYTAEGHESLLSKVTKFVDTACEYSVAMRSQETPVEAADLIEGKDLFRDELAVPQNGSIDHAKVIHVVVCPPFTASEKQSNDVVLMKGKVICL